MPAVRACPFRSSAGIIIARAFLLVFFSATPQISTSSSEGTSSGSDAETKAGEEEKATAKKGASSSTKKEVSSSTVVPDAVAHAVAIDVNW